ncbi:MAG: hypothetical protein H6632_11360 [Anaerolineales bacterium]|nr:hypothetical protein [Anaerolineales bacterium]
MNKILRVLITIFAGLLALILSLSLLTVMTASANNTVNNIDTVELPPMAPLKAAGGADNFGYTYQDENETFGPTDVFTDISGTSGVVSHTLGGDVTTDVTIPFLFQFYGAITDTIRIGNNGALLVGPPISGGNIKDNACNLDAYPYNIIAPWWDDWGNGTIYLNTFGTAPNRYVIVQWDSMLHEDSLIFGATTPVTFQAVLYESSNAIQFRYENTDTGSAAVSDGNNGTIGIKGYFSTGILQYSTCNGGDPIAGGPTIRFSQNSITIVKNTLPTGDPQNFNFSTTSITGTTTFSLTDGLSQTFYLQTGSYTVAETLPTDWDITNLSCVGGANTSTSGVTATITLGVGEAVVCTYENTKRGSITVQKNATPDSTQPFTFTGTLSPSFILDDDGTPGNPYSNTITFPSLQPGTYTATETSVAGWSLTGINCTGGDFTQPGGGSARIELDPGEDINCTFSNTQLGTLIIQKITDPPAITTSFAYTASAGLSPTTFNLTGGYSQTFSNISPGSYAITETVPSGWTMSSSCDDSSPVNNISIAAGETVTCVFTNTADPGTVTVQKVTVPAASPEVFTFTTNLSTSTNFTLSDGGSQVYNKVTVGTYSISETVPTGWTLTSNCSDGSPINAVDVGPGENITCVFTNTSNLGTITVQKVTTPSTSLAFTFTTSLSPSNFTLSNGQSQTFTNVTSGSSYTVAETTPAGWDLTSTCSDGSPITNIAVAPGEDITCTFTNTQRGAIIVDKVTVPSSNTTSFNFALTGGPDTINQTFALSHTTTPYNSGSIKPGSYSLSETPVSGWTTVAACDNGDNPKTGNITVDAGETVTCVYTNTKLSTLIVRKVTNPSPDPTTTSFNFTAGGGLTPPTFSLANGGVQTFTNLISGTYSLSETVPSGWSLTTACDNSDPISAIGIGFGETVTCVFTNTATPGSITIIKDAVPDNTQNFSFIGNPSIGAFTLDDGADADAYSNVLTFSNLAIGAYTIGELATSGWTLNNITCADPTSDTSTNPNQGQANIVLNSGENVTCTFTNTANASLGSITIKKNAVPDNSQSFAFTGSLGNFTLIDNGNPFSSTLTRLNLSPGSYSVTEGAVSGWNLTGLSCTDPDSGSSTAGSTATIDLDSGESITCVFTNTSTASSITIIKDATPDDAQAFSFTGDLGNFSLVDNGNTLSSTFTSFVSPGTYAVTEAATSGWNLSSLNCTDPDSGTTTAGSTATIDLDTGENVTCTFNNSQSTPGTVFLPMIIKDYAPPPCTDIDLEVTGLSINASVVTVVVENTGACPTDSGFWVDLYANPQTEPGTLVGVTNDRRWDSSLVNATHGMGWEVPVLAGGASITLTSDGSVGPGPTDKVWPPAAGATILAYADSFDADDPNNQTFVEIPEADETNNQSPATITFSGLGQSAASSSTQAPRRDID